jgi:hypothetical protein
VSTRNAEKGAVAGNESKVHMRAEDVRAVVVKNLILSTTISYVRSI